MTGCRAARGGKRSDAWCTYCWDAGRSYGVTVIPISAQQSYRTLPGFNADVTCGIVPAMADTVSLAIVGAAGRMGQRLVALAHEDPKLEVVAAIERADHPQLQRDIGEIAGVGPIGVLLTHDLK